MLPVPPRRECAKGGRLILEWRLELRAPIPSPPTSLRRADSLPGEKETGCVWTDAIRRKLFLWFPLALLGTDQSRE